MENLNFRHCGLKMLNLFAPRPQQKCDFPRLKHIIKRFVVKSQPHLSFLPFQPPGLAWSSVLQINPGQAEFVMKCTVSPFKPTRSRGRGGKVFEVFKKGLLSDATGVALLNRVLNGKRQRGTDYNPATNRG